MRKTIFSVLIISLLFLTACGGRVAEESSDDLSGMSPEELESMLPERCTAPNPLGCIDFSYEKSIGRVTLTVINFGTEITNFKVLVRECGRASESVDSLAANEEAVFTVDCSKHEGNNLSSEIVYHYIDRADPENPKLIETMGKISIDKSKW